MDPTPAAGPEATEAQETPDSQGQEEEVELSSESRYEQAAFDLRNIPCTWHTFKHRGLYKSRQGANQMLRRLEEKDASEVIGKIALKGEGMVSHVWAAPDGPTWPERQLMHDVIAGWVIVKLNYWFLNGEHVDRFRLPDFELYDEHGNRLAFGEIDTGSTKYAKVRTDRFEKAYAKCEETVLWITVGLWSASDTTRRDGLMELTDQPNHWFVTLQDVLDYGRNALVVNCLAEQKPLTQVLTPSKAASTEPSTAEPASSAGNPPSLPPPLPSRESRDKGEFQGI